MSLKTVCTPQHTPGEGHRMVDEKTGRVFYRKYCIHCGTRTGDNLTDEIDPAIDLLRKITRSIKK